MRGDPDKSFGVLVHIVVLCAETVVMCVSDPNNRRERKKIITEESLLNVGMTLLSMPESVTRDGPNNRREKQKEIKGNPLIKVVLLH